MIYNDQSNSDLRVTKAQREICNNLHFQGCKLGDFPELGGFKNSEACIPCIVYFGVYFKFKLFTLNVGSLK